MFHKALVKMIARVSKINRYWSSALESDKIYRLSVEDFEAYVQGKLTQLLRRCALQVKYYRDMFKVRGWDPEKAEEYWDQWPVLTQENLQDHREELLVDGVDRSQLKLDSSGGSSGFVKTFYHSDSYRKSAVPAVYWADHLAGWYPGARKVRLWGAGKDISKGQLFKNRIRFWLRDEKLCNSFDMDETVMLKYHELMRRFRPEVLLAYAGSAFQLARFLQENNLKPDYPGVSVITSAELLTEQMRREIQQVFGKEVFDRYGSREVGIIACECEDHKGLHVAMLHNYVEVVKPGTLKRIYDEDGDVLVTTLGELDAPLIKYKIGDTAVASKEKCSCGRNSLLLKKISGRVTDYIKAPDGRKIYGEYFTHLLYGMSHIRQFQVLQKTLSYLEIKLSVTKPLSDQEQENIISGFQEILSKDVSIELKIVDKISPLSSGKKSFVISEVCQE